MVKFAFKKSSRHISSAVFLNSISLLSLISSWLFPCKAKEPGWGRMDMGQAVLTSAIAKEMFTVAINELFWKLFL